MIKLFNQTREQKTWKYGLLELAGEGCEDKREVLNKWDLNEKY